MTTINLVIFGIGNVGSTLIKQINASRHKLKTEQSIHIKVPVVTNSRLAFFSDSAETSWEADFEQFSVPYKVEDIIRYIKSKGLQNLIAIDATASKELVKQYSNLISNGFHIVAANKVANTLDYKFYQDLRNDLSGNKKEFLYETNVGAGLPVIETVKRLHNSGDKITKIRGVFSGSLSYIFNNYSDQELTFSEVLKTASEFGLTEPDPREDLSGNDVARKLLILSRELGLKTELRSVKVQSLVPNQLNGKTTLHQFKSRIKELNQGFDAYKNDLSDDEVLRYVGELNVNDKNLEVKLISETRKSSLGQLKGADTLFEIYTEAYHEQPLVIQGAGAGKSVTARGVLSDILEISRKLRD